MSNAVFLPNGKSYKVGDASQAVVLDNLPVANYSLSQDDYGNFWFNQIDDFTLPEKLYGNCTQNADRIVETFSKRAQSTGVLLTGEKGSGKTLLAKTLSTKLAEINVPTLVINQPWCGEGFNNLLQSIHQPMLVLFDEFEKVYDRDRQDKILTLLDGVFNTRKMFVFTCNDRWGINTYMRNRPGRIFYSLDFDGLSLDFIREFCQDTLNDQSKVDSVCQIAGLAKKFNFDMLKSLVEEMNRYNESAKESLRMLNIEVTDGFYKYSVKITQNGKALDPKLFAPNVWEGNPLDPDGFSVAVSSNPDMLQGLRSRIEYNDDPEEVADLAEDFDYDDIDDCVAPTPVTTFRANHTNIKGMDSAAGKYTFADEENSLEVVLSRVIDVRTSYLDML